MILKKKMSSNINYGITEYKPIPENYQQITTYPQQNTQSKPKTKTIDFRNFRKIDTLTDNEFIYCRRVGNYIEFEECTYNQLKVQDKANRKIIRVKDNVEYITISKNVKSH